MQFEAVRLDGISLCYLYKYQTNWRVTNDFYVTVKAFTVPTKLWAEPG